MAKRMRFGCALSLLGLAACGTSADSQPGTTAPAPGAAASAPSAPGATRQNVPSAVAPAPGSKPAAAPSPGPSAGVAGAPAGTMTPAASAAGSGAGMAPATAMPAAPNPDAFNPYPGFKSDFYADDSAWACKPGAANNPCLEDLDATEVLPDGTTKPAPEPAPTTHAIDCLYFYPTVSRDGPQESRDFSNSSSIIGVTTSQAGRFSRVCNLYVPFYRLVGVSNGDIDLAYADVVEAFKHYIANLSEGRDFVLMGHSQGSNHGLRLLKEEIDDEPGLRARMVSAVMLGFPVQLPQGQAMGGSFKNIPICQAEEQRGCLINFMSYSAESPPASGGNASFGSIDVCTNPAALGGGEALFQGTYFPAAGSPVASSVSTKWVLYRDFFRGECKRSSGGTAYMEISRAQQSGDQRTFGMLTEISGIGLHVMDFVFSQGDLVDLVGKQAAVKP